MNRTEELMNKKGAELIAIADSYGVKCGANKERTQLKESKKVVVERIVNHEAELAAKAAEEAAKKAEKKAEAKKASKRESKTFEFNGKVQTLAEWSKELGIAESTLYGRIYYRNYSVEEAFTSKRSSKSNKTYAFNGKEQTLAEWSAELGIATSTLYGRIHYRNMTIEEAFTKKKSEVE